MKERSARNRLTRRLFLVIGVAAALGLLEILLLDLLERANFNASFRDVMVASGSILLLLAGLVTALSIAGVMLFKKTTRQQQQLIKSQAETIALKASYQQVLENLPIGLFTYVDGSFQYTNWSWDEQVLRQPSENPVKAFSRALHEEDRGWALKELDRCCRREEPFHMKLRISNQFFDERFIEMRGVPVYEADGRFRHLLGFNIDVSEAANATLELQKYNAEVERKNFMLTTALSDLEANFTAMVESLVKAVEAKDPYTAGHSERVMQYSIMVGEYFGLSAHELRTLKMGTLIHDIGKIGIPDEILTKPSGLTSEEFDIVKRHSEMGYEMIQGIPMLRECAPIVRLHHERLDGSGYPLGLKGDEIPFLVRIAAIADIFDAMTSNRAYRKGLPTRVAIDELRREAALHKVDKEIVEAFARAIARERSTTTFNHKAA
ncbi:MAG TPA: HD domain-containing phosphohydrolase [Fimbriimonadaceae bacterium]|jgi:HD-GYP domain-containing protein (c-di-GMP phosphodiesterase class II)